MHGTIKRTAIALGLGLLGAIGGGCLTRPVSRSEPTTKTNFTSVVRQAAVDKVDLLFAIDNSASMGDKQLLFSEVVPDLIRRLVTPNCVDATTNEPRGVSQDGRCPAGQKPEFQPVYDMHIGIISSALGGRGGDQCDPNQTNPVNPELNRHNDDRGQLLNRGGLVNGTPSAREEHRVPNAGQSNYLSWFPPVQKNAGKPEPAGSVRITDAEVLIRDFRDLVVGVHEYGCGLEAQLESVYRFLIQPDPYDRIALEKLGDGRTVAKLEGVDQVLLRQRKDFLRPDSLVAVIMLTDEEDSTVDPLAIGGQGWVYKSNRFPGSVGGGAARGTSACEQNPADPNCTSCAFGKASDPNCQVGGDIDPSTQNKQPGYYPAAEDTLNTRFHQMKRRYGVDPQFPISRYVDGFTKLRVPSREVTIEGKTTGEKHDGPGGNYNPDPNCTNPLFAEFLPDGSETDLNSLCNLRQSTLRTPDLVFFAVIGGVPWQLLLEDPNSPQASPFKTELSSSDWIKIVGADPSKYDYSGIDPHMWQAIKGNSGPRANLPPPSSSDTDDPYHGREWETNNTDLQYACTFALPSPKDCELPENKSACDCTDGKNPPLCQQNTNGKKTLQVRGKAYPTIRELAVVRELREQGIAASLCPRTLDKNSPDYGYRPAVAAIIDRLKNALTQQCLPQRLTRVENKVDCLILEVLGKEGDQSVCDTLEGRKQPDPKVLEKFREQQREEQGTVNVDAGGIDLTLRPVCEIVQIPVADNETCAESNDAGWCYVTGRFANNCPQSVLFSPKGNPQPGASVNLTCIEASVAPTDLERQQSADGG